MSRWFVCIFKIAFVANYVALVFYVVFVAMAMGVPFVFKDSGKLAIHLVLLPLALQYLSDVYEALCFEKWDNVARRHALLISILSPIIFGLIIMSKAVIDFESPDADRMAAAYPSDYWKNGFEAQVNDSDGKPKGLGEAVKWLYNSKREIKQYASGLAGLRIIDGTGIRNITYLNDAGPAGWLGPILSTLGAAVAGSIGAAVALVFIAIFRNYPYDSSCAHPKLFAAFLLMATGFLPLHWISTKTMWPETPCCEPIDPDVLSLFVLAIFIFFVLAILIYLHIKNSPWMRKLSKLSLGVISIISLVAPELLKYLPANFEDFIEKQAKSPIVAVAACIAFTIVTVVLAVVAVQPEAPQAE